MSHPFEKLHPAIQRRLFIFLLILTILIMLVMNMVGTILYTAESPSGIISFELAYSPARAYQIINSWSTSAQLRAAFIQGLDFLFPLVYSTMFGIGSIMAGGVLRIRGKPFARWGVILAWGLWLAAICDYIENIALITLLFGRVVSPFPEIAGVCAVIKFAMILIGSIYIIYGLVMRIIPKRSTRAAT
jgi:hypothetical protein